jgi:hypothetical protein
VDTSDTYCPPATTQVSNFAIAQGDENSTEKLVDMFGPHLKPSAAPFREAELVAEVPAGEVQPPSAAVHARDFQSDGFPKEGFIGTIPCASIHMSNMSRSEGQKARAPLNSAISEKNRSLTAASLLLADVSDPR